MKPQEISECYNYRSDLKVLFNFKTGTIHRLENDVAEQIYLLGANGKSEVEIASIIADKYSADYGEVYKDVGDFFQKISPLSTTAVSHQWYNLDKGFDNLLKFPLRMEIEVTALCNWDCGFCYNVWKIDPTMSDLEIRKKIKQFPKKFLSKEMAFKILDELSSKGCFIVRYSGGETTLHPDLLDILEYGGKKRLFQVLFTNGHYLTDEYCLKLSEYNVRTVLISLHGMEVTQNNIAGRKNAYDLTIRGIKNALQAGLEVVVEMTLVKENLEEVEDILSLIHDLGVSEFRIMRYVETGKNDEKYVVPIKEMLPLMQKIDHLKRTKYNQLNVGWPCGQKYCTSEFDSPLQPDDPTSRIRFEQLTGSCEAGLVWGSIAYDGQVRHCPHSNVYFGKISNEEIEPIWQRLTQEVADVLKPRNSCSGCSFSSSCKGGCHLPHFLTKHTNSSVLAS